MHLPRTLIDMCSCSAAIILERIVGHDVTKPVSEAAFCDVHYLQHMLHSVFTALHQAQRKLAFHHADLRLANIMEALPSAFEDNAPCSSMTPRAGTIQAAALFDSQHVSGFLQHLPSNLDTPSCNNSSSQSADISRFAAQTSGQSQPTQNPGLSLKHSRDFAIVSQSPATRFKMIDFGLADFRETYGAGYVTGKHDTLVHREPHRQPSLQFLLSPVEKPSSSDNHSSSNDHSNSNEHSNSSAADFPQHDGGVQQDCSSSNQRSRIDWISDDKPQRRASRRFFPAALLPEVTYMAILFCQSRDAHFNSAGHVGSGAHFGMPMHLHRSSHQPLSRLDTTPHTLFTQSSKSPGMHICKLWLCAACYRHDAVPVRFCWQPSHLGVFSTRISCSNMSVLIVDIVHLTWMMLHARVPRLLMPQTTVMMLMQNVLCRCLLWSVCTATSGAGKAMFILSCGMHAGQSVVLHVATVDPLHYNCLGRNTFSLDVKVLSWQGALSLHDVYVPRTHGYWY